jgi:hypothetical protein
MSIAQRKTELEELDLKRAAIQQEIAALEKEDVPLPVMRRAAFDKLPPADQRAYCAEVTSGKARLID